MICNNCGSFLSRVDETLWIKNNTEIRRYRVCLSCGNRFKTIEKAINEFHESKTRTKSVCREIN